MTGTARIIRADSRHLPLADDSVDLVVTSPPYFALRSYTDNGVHYEQQIGAEATPDEFVTSLLEVTAECVRVLKPSGSLWVNLGDKYAGSGPGGPQNGQAGTTEQFIRKRTTAGRHGLMPQTSIRPKSLLGIPWRYALRCIDDLGLILRAEVIWSKPNGLPESVTDRVRRSHEQWFHFTASPRYFSAVDEIREPYRQEQHARGQAPNGANPLTGGMPTNHPRNALGALPGSVWTIPTEPLNVPDHLGVDHFAAFPTAFPRRIIAGWSPTGVCVICDQALRPEVERKGDSSRARGRDRDYVCGCNKFAARADDHEMPWQRVFPAVVLDPFGGTGTTALVAKALGRDGISVDMSADYCRLAQWRVNDPDSLAKAMRGDKPAKQVDGQGSLLDLFEEGIA